MLFSCFEFPICLLWRLLVGLRVLVFVDCMLVRRLFVALLLGFGWLCWLIVAFAVVSLLYALVVSVGVLDLVLVGYYCTICI